MRTKQLAVCLFSLLSITGNAIAQTSYPMITHTSPVAVQRGKTTEVMVEGQMNFFGVYKALFEGTGIEAEIVAPPGKVDASQKGTSNSAKLKLSVAADAPLGVREFRLASRLGISSIGQLVVVQEPVVNETEPNNTIDKSNPIALPCVVHGLIGAIEDVDTFKFRASAGQAITAEVYCARIQDKIHDLQKHADPMVTLLDSAGRELAANDDFYFADPLLSYTIPKEGDYFLQIRDSKFDGDRRWVYALLVTNSAYLSNVYPMAGNPGQTIDVEPIGSVQSKVTKLRVPEQAGLTTVQLDINGTLTNPTAFVVSPLPQVLENEPNDETAKATPVTLPCCINGRIGTKRDLDHFRFAGTKGKAVRFEVKARRFGTVLQSSVDSVLDILSAKGDVLMSNDDSFGKDASLVFTPPADADYLVRVRDLNSKGGPSFVYCIEADWARPDFTLRCDPDKAMIGPGSSTAWYVHVTRLNGFTGSVNVMVKGLPERVTASPLIIPASMTQGVIVLSADPDATRDAANVSVVGTATIKTPDGKDETIERPTTPNEEIYNPGGGRGRFDVNLQSVAVTDISDIERVEVTPRTIMLKPGEEVRIDVNIRRRPDYDKVVNIDVPLNHLGSVFGNPLPTGVTVDPKSKTALGTGSQGFIILKAAPTAMPIEPVPISVLAHVSINFVVKVSYSSPVIMVGVQK